MRKLGFWTLLGVTVLLTGSVVIGKRTSEKIRYHTLVGPVYIGQMSPQNGEQTLDRWWTERRERPIHFESRALVKPIEATPAQLGITIDAHATVARAPRGSLLDIFRKPKTSRLAPVYRMDADRFASFVDDLDASVKDPSRAKVFYLAGDFHRVPESGHAAVDRTKLRIRLMNALSGRDKVEVPFTDGEKKVSEQDLASIQEVVSEFTTHFSTGKKSRCANIKLASSKLNGIVLMPGDLLSFNDMVGRRTQAGGFQLAGVYKNGKHDVDVGGGICQVSTTLYNAALLADLKIIHRHNHSMPVPYVPLGRDATVDYGVLDMAFENDTEKPIAINSEYHPGTLTFRVLGTKDPSLHVQIESDGKKRWDAGMQLVVDTSLKPGQRKTVEKGAPGEQVSTYRLIYRNGKLERRESLGTSYYKGGQKIIAVGPSQPVAPSGGFTLVSADSH